MILAGRKKSGMSSNSFQGGGGGGGGGIGGLGDVPNCIIS